MCQFHTRKRMQCITIALRISGVQADVLETEGLGSASHRGHCQHQLQTHQVLVMGASHFSAPCLYVCNGDTGVTGDRYWLMSLAYSSHLTVSIFKVHPLLWASPQSSMSITLLQSLSQTSSPRSGNLFKVPDQQSSCVLVYCYHDHISPSRRLMQVYL